MVPCSYPYIVAPSHRSVKSFLKVLSCLHINKTLFHGKMKKIIPVVMILLTAGAANAGGLVTKHASSVQLTVDAARSTASRIGSSFSISGSGVDTTDGSTAGTISAGTITSGVYILALLQQLKILLAMHLVSVSLIHKVMLFLNQHLQLVLFLTSVQLLLTQTELQEICWFCRHCWCPYRNRWWRWHYGNRTVRL